MEGLGIGRIVHYVLTEQDAKVVNRRRTTSKSIADRSRQLSEKWPEGAQAHIGNEVRAGQEYPMIVVMVLESDNGSCSGQVFLDGNDVLWVSSWFDENGTPSTWHWPERD